MDWWILLIGTPAMTVAGYFSGMAWLLPALQVIPAYPLMVRDLRREKPGLAILRMLVWAALIASTIEALAVYAPAPGAASVAHGTAYRDEMIAWVRTGVGKESQPLRFLPEHALHVTAFVILSLLSGSLLSLALGACLLNYMSYYVGSLLGIAEIPSVVLLAGWPPWAVVRVVSFVVLGVALSGPVLRRFASVPFQWRNQRAWILLAGFGLILDALLKAILAPRWSVLLRSALFPLTGF